MPERTEQFTTQTERVLQIRAGHTLLLDEQFLAEHCSLRINAGLVRVSVSQPDQDALECETITLGFLQAGDQLPLDLLRQSRLHLEALTPARLEGSLSPIPPSGCSSLNEWTVALLRIRHLGEAEQRITALLQLLVERLGRRHGDWYELPLRLTHAELAELSGHTRVTVTRQLSRWRKFGLITHTPRSSGSLRISPLLVESGS